MNAALTAKKRGGAVTVAALAGSALIVAGVRLR